MFNITFKAKIMTSKRTEKIQEVNIIGIARKTQREVEWIKVKVNHMEPLEKKRKAEEQLSKSNKILVIAATSRFLDGGTIARYANEGHEVNILIMAEGETSRHKTRDRESAESVLYSLSKAAKKSCKLLG